MKWGLEMKVKKKILAFLLIVPLLLTVIPFNSASAYDGGYLNGKTMNVGKTINDISRTTTLVTDNNPSTFETVNNTNSNFTWYEFDTPISFKAFKLLAQESSFWRIAAFDYYGNRIWYVDNPVKDGSQQTVTEVKNVKKIAIERTLSNAKLYEFDISGVIESPVDNEAPNGITNLVLNGDTNTSITATWTDSNSSDLAYYEIYLNDVLVSSSLKTNSYTFDSLEEGTEYTVKVVALDSSGNKSPGVFATIRTGVTDRTPPEEIKELKLAATTNTIEATWTGSTSSDFDHYELYVNGELKEGNWKGNSYSINNLSEATEYTIKVVSVDSSGNKSEGISSSIKTKPPQIIGDKYEELPNGDYKVTWDEPTSGTVIVTVGDKEFTVPASDGEFIIPKEDMEYTGLDEPDISLTPVSENGEKGEVKENPKLSGLEVPFKVSDLVGTGNGLLWLIAPFVLLGLSFLLFPKFRNLIFSSVRENKGEKAILEHSNRRYKSDEIQGKETREKGQVHEGKSYLGRMERLEKQQLSKGQTIPGVATERQPRQRRFSPISAREPRTPRQPRQPRIVRREPRQPREPRTSRRG